MYGLYVITDERLSGGRSHSEVARLACEGGADAIQLRDKHMGKEEMIRVAREIRAITSLHSALFFVNDHFDVAAASEADGVHLGQDDIHQMDDAKRAGMLAGVSARTADDCIRAERDGADYLGIGPVFGTSSKPDAPGAIGTRVLAEIRKKVRIPIVAIGGITKENAPDAIRAGADGVAVISAVVSQDDIKKAAEELKNIVSRSLRASEGRR